jgi:hypothetical protein
MKIRPEGAELFHTDRQTDTYDETNSRFSQFCERAYSTEVSVDKVLNEIQGSIYRTFGSEVGEPQRVSYWKMKVHC